MSKPWGRLRKFLWPCQKSWTSCTTTNSRDLQKVSVTLLKLIYSKKIGKKKSHLLFTLNIKGTEWEIFPNYVAFSENLNFSPERLKWKKCEIVEVSKGT